MNATVLFCEKCSLSLHIINAFCLDKMNDCFIANMFLIKMLEQNITEIAMYPGQGNTSHLFDKRLACGKVASGPSKILSSFFFITDFREKSKIVENSHLLGNIRYLTFKKILLNRQIH